MQHEKSETDSTKEQLEQITTVEKYLKQLCARLYPEAIKLLPAVDSNNLEDWLERVLNLIIEQELQKHKLVPKDNKDNTNINNLNKTSNAAPTIATSTTTTTPSGLSSDADCNNKESFNYLSDNNSNSCHNESSSVTEVQQVQINSHHNNSNNISKISNNNDSNSNSNSDKKPVSF